MGIIISPGFGSYLLDLLNDDVRHIPSPLVALVYDQTVPHDSLQNLGIGSLQRQNGDDDNIVISCQEHRVNTNNTNDSPREDVYME